MRADEILSRVLRYRLARSGIANVGLPLVLTFSFTNLCNSRCKTCNIWKNPTRHGEELNLSEIEKIFKSIGKLYFLNVSGGEPFLRKDIVDVIKLILRYSSPNLLHIPSNGLLPDLILQRVTEILDAVDEKKTFLTIKLSLDGVGESHDAVRGVPGGFAKMNETYSKLSELRKEHPNFHLGFNTVISNFNVDNLNEIINCARSLEPDSFVTEIAENRSELFNLAENITPDGDTYRELISNFRDKTQQDLKHRRSISKFNEASRLVYYDYVVRILREKRQVLPCYAGISNAHLNPFGEVWPCCILAYNQTIGNVRDFDCDFRRLWNSSKATAVRGYVKGNNCYCPLANQSNSNILCSTIAMAKVSKNILLAR